MAQALLFNITGDKKKKLQFLLMQYGVAAREAGPGDHAQPLGKLLGKKGVFPPSAAAPDMDGVCSAAADCARLRPQPPQFFGNGLHSAAHGAVPPQLLHCLGFPLHKIT